jgi:hypothetical protein
MRNKLLKSTASGKFKASRSDMLKKVNTPNRNDGYYYGRESSVNSKGMGSYSSRMACCAALQCPPGQYCVYRPEHTMPDGEGGLQVGSCSCLNKRAPGVKGKVK